MPSPYRTQETSDTRGGEQVNIQTTASVPAVSLTKSA